MLTVLRTIVIIVLCSISFFPVLRFFSPELSGGSMGIYLLAFAVHTALLLAAGLFLTRTSKGIGYSSVKMAAVLLFLSGVIFVGAFGMGAPPRDAAVYMANREQEIWRGVLLMLAALSAFGGVWKFHRAAFKGVGPLWTTAFLLLVTTALIITIYDFWWGTFIIPQDITAWSASGKDIGVFFDHYDLKNFLRGTGRSLIYLVTVIILLFGWKQKLIKPWVAIVLSILCLFFLQEVLIALMTDVKQVNAKIGMVPAVALSPLYFLGIYLLATIRINGDGLSE